MNATMTCSINPSNCISLLLGKYVTDKVEPTTIKWSVARNQHVANATNRQLRMLCSFDSNAFEYDLNVCACRTCNFCHSLETYGALITPLLGVFKYSLRQMAIDRGVAIKSVTYSGEIWCDLDNGEIDCAHDCLPQFGFYAN